MGLRYRYQYSPSLEQLAAIEHTALIEREPVGASTGTPVGLPLIIGEVPNDRPFDDDGVQVNALVAAMVLDYAHLRSKYGELSPYIGDPANDDSEGNLHVQSQSLDHLWPAIVVPVDAAAKDGNGAYVKVTVSRPAVGTAAVVCANEGPYDLEPGETLTVATDGGGAETVTFDAAAAALTGQGATYAACTGGHTVNIQVDGGVTQSIACAGTENSQELWHNLINGAVRGAQVVNAGGQSQIRSDMRGTGSKVEVMDTSDADVLAALGFVGPPAAATGTGDVVNIDVVTPDEVASRINADTSGCTSAVDNVTRVRITTDTPGAGGSIRVTGGTANTAIGFSTDLVSGGTGALPVGIMRGGSRLRQTNLQVWLLAEDAKWGATDLTKDIRVRPGYGTVSNAGIGTITTFVDLPTWDPTFTVTNAAIVPVPNLGLRYEEAASVAGNPTDLYASLGAFFVACRHTETEQDALTEAAVNRSTTGKNAIAFNSPPCGTSMATAQGSSGVGVASTTFGGRTEFAVYAWGSHKSKIRVGGSTVTLTLPNDMSYAAAQSRMLPEESIGEPRAANWKHVIGVGSEMSVLGTAAFASYTALKASGISALIRGATGYYPQSAVTRSLMAGKTHIQRRTFIGFIGDSIAAIAEPYKDRPATMRNRRNLVTRIYLFLKGLEDAGRLGQETGAFTVVDTTTDAMRRANVICIDITVDAPSTIGTPAFNLRVEPGALALNELEAAA